MKTLKNLSLFLISLLFLLGCSKTTVEEHTELKNLSEVATDFTLESSDTNPEIAFKKGPQPPGDESCCSQYTIDIIPLGETNGCCSYKLILYNNSPTCKLALEDLNGNTIMNLGPQTANIAIVDVCQTTHYVIRSSSGVCETISLEENCNILGDECCDVKVVAGDVSIGSCCWIEAFVYNYGGCPLYLFTENGIVQNLGTAPYTYLSYVWCADDIFYIGETTDPATACTSFGLPNCYQDQFN